MSDPITVTVNYDGQPYRVSFALPEMRIDQRNTPAQVREAVTQGLERDLLGPLRDKLPIPVGGDPDRQAQTVAHTIAERIGERYEDAAREALHRHFSGATDDR